MWISENEGAKFWLSVVTELQNRDVQDIFIACVDGLKGFPEAIEAVFPQTQVQLCLVHLMRHSLAFVGYKERKAVATGLKAIYQSATVQEAAQRLEEFEAQWDDRYPLIGQSCWSILAAQLGAAEPDVWLSRRDPPRHLHH
jgi:putative transposase